jgi:hypothetical protein
MANSRRTMGPADGCDMRKAHARPEHMPQGSPCTRCGLPFLWHRVRHPTPEYLDQKHQARVKWLESRRQSRLEEAKLAESRLGAMVLEYESKTCGRQHVTKAFKRKLFEAWWETRRAAVRHELAVERLVRHLGRGPFTWKGRIYIVRPHDSVELIEDPHERVKRSWENWDDKEIENELSSWKKLT